MEVTTEQLFARIGELTVELGLVRSHAVGLERQLTAAQEEIARPNTDAEPAAE